MKNYLLCILLCILYIQVVPAQKTIKLSFEKSNDIVYRQETDVVFPISLKLDSVKIDKDSLSQYIVTIKPSDEKSTLAKSCYSLAFNSITLDKMSSSYTFYINLQKDTLGDINRQIYFLIEIKRKSQNADINISDSNKTLNLIVQGFKRLNNFRYLAYVGTNFDLVDGVKAQNLFFATNVFLPPQSIRERFGLNFSLYGNRTLSQTDTSGRVRYTSKIIGLGGDSARYFQEEALKTVNRVSDNLGVSFSPLVWLGKVSNPNRTMQLYYAPQLEFIWRRTKISTSYTNSVIVDSSLIRQNRPITGVLTLTPPKTTTPINIYDVYIGLAGFFLSHENEYISLRLQGSLGVNFSYMSSAQTINSIQSSFDRSFSFLGFGRAWITEPVSGITLGAEVSNTFGNRDRYQPYFNVTLSKAIKLKSLGTIVEPVTAR